MASGGGDGKDNVPVLSDDDEMPPLCDNSDNEDAEWDDVDEEEMNVLVGKVKCLFSSKVFESVDELIHHLRKEYSFDLPHICCRFSLDCISYIKLINYIRIKNPTPEEVMTGLQGGGLLWSSDDFMKAVDPDDLMLQFDAESAQLTETSSNSTASEAEMIAALTFRLKKADDETAMLKEELKRAVEEIEKLRESGQQFVMRMSSNDKKKEINGVIDDSLNEEDGYFASYTHHDIHATMLKDKVRTESYRDFMLQNPHLFEGKTVLDVGCGTGILSMFAVKAGASRVVAVDQSNIIYQAMDIARENNMHEKITFVKGKLEDVTLPIEKFDIIISEWMGYFLLFEAMLDSVLWARDRYLAPGGCVYPDHFTMDLVGVEDPEMRNSKLEFWDSVYNFKMSCMKTSVLDEVYVKHVKSSTIATEPAVIKDIDALTCQVSDLEFAANFSLKCMRDAELTGIVGYFTTDFHKNCKNKVSFSTGPEVPPTHWEQAIMFLPKPLSVKSGASIDGRIIYKKHPKDSRGIILSLTLGKQTMKYTLS